MLINFFDLGFFLYDIEGYEYTNKDLELFIDYKNSELLQFNINEDLLEKKKFQSNYTNLYFHYLINLFKTSQSYEFSIPIENFLFEDNSFYYPTFDTSMTENRLDFLYFLEQFLKGFKSICLNKTGQMADFINILVLHYSKLSEAVKSFDFDLLYDSKIGLNIKPESLVLMEQTLISMMDV